MRVGDYARTYRGQLFKIKDSNLLYDIFSKYENKIELSDSELINLIKEDDYINGKRVTQVIPPDICGDEQLSDAQVYVDGIQIYKEEIEQKNIVTKEQFQEIEISNKWRLS